MTRKTMKEAIKNQLGDALTPELGPTLELFGSVCKELWHEENGVYLNADERADKQAANKVLAVADSVSNIEIHLGNGKKITMASAKPDKPAVVIPFGMNDRVTPAAMPKDWLPMALYQHLIDAFEGDTTYAQDVAEYLNKCIDAASEVSEAGKLSINKKLLPTPAATVFTLGLVDSHKRMFKSSSKGSTVFNLTCNVEYDDITPLRIPPRLTGFISSTEIKPPDVPPMFSASQPEQARITTEVATIASEDKETDNGGMSVSDYLFNVLGNDSLTKGMIRKEMVNCWDNVPEPMWVAELDKMVKTGAVVKDSSGGPRSTKYAVLAPIPNQEVSQ